MCILVRDSGSTLSLTAGPDVVTVDRSHGEVGKEGRVNV